MSFNYLIYLLTAIGFTSGGSSTLRIYTQTIHTTTQLTTLVGRLSGIQTQSGQTKINLLTPNDPYMGRTAPLTSKRCILYIYSTSTGTEYFKLALYSPFFSLQNTVCFITLTCLVPVLFTFYIQSVIKLK